MTAPELRILAPIPPDPPGYEPMGYAPKEGLFSAENVLENDYIHAAPPDPSYRVLRRSWVDDGRVCLEGVIPGQPTRRFFYAPDHTLSLTRIVDENLEP